MNRATPLPEDVDALKALVLRRVRDLAARDTTLSFSTRRSGCCSAKRFRASGERVAEAQLGLFNEAEQDAESAADEEEAPESIEVPANSRRVPKRKPLDPNLPRVRVVHDLAEHDKCCPHDGSALECI